MAKILKGVVVSTSMQNTVVIEVTMRKVHPLYKKILKRTKKYKVETNGQSVALGDTVSIIETKPIAKDKHFMLYTENKVKKEKKESK